MRLSPAKFPQNLYIPKTTLIQQNSYEGQSLEILILNEKIKTGEMNLTQKKSNFFGL